MFSRENRLEALERELGHLLPCAVLGRGYALVQNAAGQVITGSKEVNRGDKVSIEFHDGKRGAVIED